MMPQIEAMINHRKVNSTAFAAGVGRKSAAYSAIALESADYPAGHPPDDFYRFPTSVADLRIQIPAAWRGRPSRHFRGNAAAGFRPRFAELSASHRPADGNRRGRRSFR